MFAAPADLVAGIPVKGNDVVAGGERTSGAADRTTQTHRSIGGERVEFQLVEGRFGGFNLKRAMAGGLTAVVQENTVRDLKSSICNADAALIVRDCALPHRERATADRNSESGIGGDGDPSQRQ